MKYVIIASAFSGNQGAASMLEASIQTISKKDKNAQFILFSMYPKQDARLNPHKQVEVLNATPLVLGFIINPLALVYKIIPPLRPLLRKQKHIRALAKSDALLDQGGITFVDGRGKFIIYNIATILPGIFTNTPVIKCSQAMGPFNEKINRLAAKLLLPKMEIIFARGNITEKHLSSLKLNNVQPAADYAFLMQIGSAAKARIKTVFKSYGVVNKARLIGVLPSEVVRKKYDASGGDYVKLNQKFIEHLIEDGYEVMLLPHSTRFQTNDTHNNDLPLCRAIAAGIESSKLHFLQDELNAQEVRAAIGSCEMIVTSRFHAMVSALSTCTPALIVGWSHKYKEVMDSFELGDCAVDSSDMKASALEEGFKQVYARREKIARQIEKQLPAVIESAQTQVKYITQVRRS